MINVAKALVVTLCLMAIWLNLLFKYCTNRDLYEMLSTVASAVKLLRNPTIDIHHICGISTSIQPAWSLEKLAAYFLALTPPHILHHTCSARGACPIHIRQRWGMSNTHKNLIRWPKIWHCAHCCRWVIVHVIRIVMHIHHRIGCCFDPAVAGWLAYVCIMCKLCVLLFT